MEQLLEQLFSSFDLPLMASIIFLSYIIIKGIDKSKFKNTSKFGKQLITALGSLLLCIAYFYIIKLPIEKIVPTYLLTTALYDILIKKILDKLNVSYTKKNE